MVLLTIFLTGFVVYRVYKWCYDMLPWIFPGLHIFGYSILPESITLYGFMITLLNATVRDLLPLLVIIGSYMWGSFSVIRKSKLSPMSEYRPDVNVLVQNTAISLGLEAPECYVMESQEPNALIVGRRKKSAKLIITSKLFEIKDLSTIKAVIVHELSHILNKDMVFMTWANNFVKSAKYWFPILCLHMILYNLIFLDYLLPSIHQLTFILFNVLFLVVIPFPLINSLSRVREFLADARTSLIIGSEHVSSTLKDIRSLLIKSRITSSFLPKHLKFARLHRPGKNKILDYLRVTHPSIDERIDAAREGTYTQTGTLSLEASIWIGIITAFFAGLCSEFLSIFYLYILEYTFNVRISSYAFFEFLVFFQVLLPSVLIAVFFMFGVKGTKFPKISSNIKIISFLSFYLKQNGKNMIIAIIAHLIIFLPWSEFFGTSILFEPYTPLWENPQLMHLLLSLALKSTLVFIIATFIFSFLAIMLMFCFCHLFGFTQEKLKPLV